MKHLLLFSILLVPTMIFAQIGIGTTNPSSVLDIRSSNQAIPQNTDGILIPKVDVFPSTNPTASQQSMLVYLTTTSGGNRPGFYYWDNPTTRWIPLSGHWNHDTTGYLVPSVASDRVEIAVNNDATGISGTGSLEIANSLRLDGNEVITNTGTELFLQNGNNGDMSVDNTTLFVDASTNRVGIGNYMPSASLHVSGTVRIADGTQAVGRVLTSSADGTASWQEQSISTITGYLGNPGINIPHNATNYRQTGSYITLPPGRWAVNVVMLLASGTTANPFPNNASFWLRTSFSTYAGMNPTPTADIVGSPLISGSMVGPSVFGLVSGTVIINNTTAANRTYYYIAGNTQVYNTTNQMSLFGGTTWDEDNIIAYRLD